MKNKCNFNKFVSGVLVILMFLGAFAQGLDGFKVFASSGLYDVDFDVDLYNESKMLEDDLMKILGEDLSDRLERLQIGENVDDSTFSTLRNKELDALEQRAIKLNQRATEQYRRNKYDGCHKVRICQNIYTLHYPRMTAKLVKCENKYVNDTIDNLIKDYVQIEDLTFKVTSIGKSAFDGCSGLTGELRIPEGVTEIGESAFRGCSGLTGELKIPEGVTKICGSAFCGCSGLTGELRIPEGVTGIGKSAFEGCSGLTGELKIPEGVTEIGESAFKGCSGLTGELEISEHVIEVGESAFRGCSGLTGELIIMSGETKISKYAFWGCTKLTKVIVPKNTKIGDNAFPKSVEIEKYKMESECGCIII